MKVALLCPDIFTIWQFRRGLIKALQKQGVSVHVICAADEYVSSVETLGSVFHPVEFSRFIDPKQDIKYFLSLWKIFRSERFDIVHNNTVKPNVYGAIVAKLTGVSRIIAMVEGLGFAFSKGGSLRRKFLRKCVRSLYHLGFYLSDKIWFVNEDDMNNMETIGYTNPEKSVLIRSGGGLNLFEYSLSSVDGRKIEQLRNTLGLAHGNLLISLIVSRLLWSKGIQEFLDAAQELSTKFRNATFLLVGGVENKSPDSVPESFITSVLPENVRWLNFFSDVRELMALSDIIVLPSYYGEGLPYVLLEAMAMSKAIVTTDNVGCREVVDHGENGYIVPVRDSHALAEAIGILLEDEDKRNRFGHHSRNKVEAEFDEKTVIARALELLYKLN